MNNVADAIAFTPKPPDIISALREDAHPQDHRKVITAVVRAWRDRRRVSVNYRLRCIDGRYRTVRMDIWPDGEGVAGAVIADLPDVPRVIPALIALECT